METSLEMEPREYSAVVLEVAQRIHDHAMRPRPWQEYGTLPTVEELTGFIALGVTEITAGITGSKLQKQYKDLDGKKVRVIWKFGPTEGVLDAHTYNYMIHVGNETIGIDLVRKVEAIEEVAPDYDAHASPCEVCGKPTLIGDNDGRSLCCEHGGF